MQKKCKKNAKKKRPNQSSKNKKQKKKEKKKKRDSPLNRLEAPQKIAALQFPRQT